MALPSLFTNRRFLRVFALAVILGSLYLIVNIFMVGGNDFVYNLNSFLVGPLAILTSILAARLWRKMKSGVQSRLLWGGLFMGWICWAIAESLWAGYSLAGVDPYPSWADFFFLVGYLPLSFGFMSRLRRLPHKPDASQKLLIWVTSLIVISVTAFFILLPIIQEYDPDRLLENLLGLFYPLADLVLLLLVLNLLFTYGPGEYGLGWRLILVGFVTVTISDLFFAYADWNGLYYPDGQATMVSTLAVDTLYSASYVLWTLGIYALSILLREHRTFEINFQPRLTTNAHVFLFTTSDETVIEVSRNYFHLFPFQDPCNRPLADALGISKQEQIMIHNKLATDKKLTDYPVRLGSPPGVAQDGWLCGLSIANSPDEYSGAVILLRTFINQEADNELSEYERSLVPFILEKTGSSENHSIRLMFLDYYLAYIKSLLNLTLQEGGAAMSQALLDELQSTARENGWKLQFNPQTILDSRMESNARIGEALAALVEVAKQFTARLTDAGTVEEEIRKIHAQFGEAVHITVSSLRERNKNRT